MLTRLLVLVAAFFLPLMIAGCSLEKLAQQQQPGFADATCGVIQKPTQIFVTNLGWHTGIVLPRNSVGSLAELLPFTGTFNYTEFGWGDREFYAASGYSYWKAFKAALFSGGSALHVASFDSHPASFFSTAEVINLTIDADHLPALVGYLAQSLADRDQPEALGKSLYGQGSFYNATGSFSILYTCNSWTADALRVLGCNLPPVARRASTISRALKQEGTFNQWLPEL